LRRFLAAPVEGFQLPGQDPRGLSLRQQPVLHYQSHRGDSGGIGQSDEGHRLEVFHERPKDGLLIGWEIERIVAVQAEQLLEPQQLPELEPAQIRVEEIVDVLLRRIVVERQHLAIIQSVQHNDRMPRRLRNRAGYLRVCWIVVEGETSWRSEVVFNLDKPGGDFLLLPITAIRHAPDNHMLSLGRFI
jgi:hypothetical protein